MEEIEQALRDIIPVLERLAKVSGITGWLMFVVTLGVGLAAIVITIWLALHSNTALAQIKTLAEKIEKDYDRIIDRLFVESKRKDELLSDIMKRQTKQQIEKNPEVPAATVETIVTEAVEATGASLESGGKWPVGSWPIRAWPKGPDNKLHFDKEDEQENK